MDDTTEVFDVIIVGSGFAGLSAAYELSATSLSTVLLEARDRVGGRTETTEDGIDVGGQWIGASHSSLLKFVDKYHHLTLQEQFYSPTASFTLTECIGYNNPVMTTQEENEIKHFVSLFSSLSEQINVDAPWAHPSAKQWDAISAKDYILANVKSQIAQNELLLLASTVFSADPKNISFLFFLFVICSSGGMEALGDGPDGNQKWKLVGGMSTLAEAMLSDISARIYYDTQAYSVFQDDHSVTVTCKSKDGTISEFIGKKAIFAMSPSLVHNVEFFPPLPNAKMQLNSLFIPGQATKIILVYKEPFWIPNPYVITATGCRSACHVRAPFFLRSGGRGDSRPVTRPVHFTTLGPIHNIFHAEFLIKGTEHYGLVCLLTGTAAEEYQKKKFTQRQTIIMDQLTTIYGHEETLRNPVHYFEKIWGEEQFSAGCFCGVVPPGKGFYLLGRNLRTPVNNVHWASTESATEFYGYIEGAVRSGARAAEEIINELERRGKL